MKATPLNALMPWRWIVVNSSGGKDSQTALRYVVSECDQLGIDRDRIVVSHQCLGELEWPGTLELVQAQADHYGLRLEVSSYRNREGAHLSLLDYVRRRGKWPDAKNRFCTSEFKRGPGKRVITKLRKESIGNILNVFGFRAEESPSRAKRRSYVRNSRCSARRSDVWNWLPIHKWTTREVWWDIAISGVPYHPAYDLGMKRLSCRFCIFAPPSALIISGKANPELLERYCRLEEEIGHTFQNGRSLRDIQKAVLAGECPGSDDGKWNM